MVGTALTVMLTEGEAPLPSRPRSKMMLAKGDHVKIHIGEIKFSKQGSKRPPSKFPSNQAQKMKEPQSLHFVKVTAGSLQGHQDAEEKRSVRSHVMRDYLRHIKEPLPAPTALAMGPDMTQHIGRFRSVVKPRRDGQGRLQVVETGSISEAAKPLKRLRPVKPLPKVDQPAEEIPIDPAPCNWKWKQSPFALPIDISLPDTSELLEYYHTSFWENSFAVNSEGSWLSSGMSDPATLHATLSLVAQYRAAMTAQPLSKAYYTHRGEAMKIISARLGDSNQAISDKTIGAVAILSNADNHSLWTHDVQESHIRGLMALVDLRGGLNALHSNVQIKRVVGWADLFHASVHDRDLRLEPCRIPVDMNLLHRFVSKHLPEYLTQIAIDLDVPRSVFELCRRLQILGAVKTSLFLDRNRAACDAFSMLLYNTERELFTLGPETVQIDEEHSKRRVWQSWPIYRAIKSAMLIHTFHCMRDLPISATVFDSFVDRLRQNLGIFLEGLYEQKSLTSLPEGIDNTDRNFESVLDGYVDPALLLNLLMNSWKASSRRGEDREWFRDQAKQICQMYQIETKEDFCDRVHRVMFSAEYCPTVANALWGEINR